MQDEQECASRSEEIPRASEPEIKRPVGRPPKERHDEGSQEPKKKKRIGRPPAKPLFEPNPDVYKRDGNIVSERNLILTSRLSFLFLGGTRN